MKNLKIENGTKVMTPYGPGIITIMAPQYGYAIVQLQTPQHVVDELNPIDTTLDCLGINDLPSDDIKVSLSEIFVQQTDNK